MTIYEWFSSQKGQLLLAGAAGAAVSVVMEWEGVGPGIRKLFVGVTTAYFLGPIGVPAFAWALGKIDVPPEQSASVGGFVVGVGGMIIIEILLKAWRMRLSRIKEENDDAGE